MLVSIGVVALRQAWLSLSLSLPLDGVYTVCSDICTAISLLELLLIQQCKTQLKHKFIAYVFVELFDKYF